MAGKLRKQLPRLELMLYEYQTDLMLEKLHSGEIDVGILALPVPLDGLESYELYKEPFTVAMPADHRLAQRASIKVADLHDETLLLLEDGHCLRDQALDICSGTDLHEKQDFRATSLETLRQMVAAGVGITLLPELAGPRRLWQRRAASPSSPSPSRCRRAPSARCGASRARGAQSSSRSSQADRGARAVSRAPAVRQLRRARTGASSLRHWFAAPRSDAACIVMQRRHRISAVVLFQAGAVRRRARLRHAALRLPRHGAVGAGRPRAPRPARMSDWGLLDMRAALDARRGTRRRVCRWSPSATASAANSSDCCSNHALACAHVQIATSVGYWRWEHAPFRYLAWWFWRVHGPLMLALRGYIPTGGGWAGLAAAARRI